ncbi:hypothetical protein MKX01_038508 [Papaver californicum]|nr:hypothetical protein MKX01_038508 [Papaver californicum]
MAQEEEQQRCSNSNTGGGKISKKVKTKKIPQRGLGVAQLEKIRLEEQQKKDTSVFVPSLLPHNHQSSSSSVSSISFSQSCSTINNVSTKSSTSLFRSQPSISYSNFDLYIPPPPPPPPQPTSLPQTNTFYGYPLPEGSENGGSSYSSSAMGVSCEFDVNGRNVDPNRFTIGSHTDTTWPSINIQQQSKYQQHQSTFTRVNVSFPTSLSSGLNIQMEPPSNQSFYNNYAASQMWPEEDKMVGMKRPWPFAIDNPLLSSFPYKLPNFGPQIYRLDESSSCVNASMFTFEPGNTTFREGPSNSAPPLFVERRVNSLELNPMKGNKETGVLERDFLTLGPPPTNSSLTSFKAKHPLVFPVPPLQDFAEFDIPPFQIYNEEEHHQPPYSFFPPKGQHVSNMASKSKDQRGEVGDNLDLSLRL